MDVYPATNEVFVADGYGNSRIIVLDADTGVYKRHWDAYGNRPDDTAPKTPVFEGPGEDLGGQRVQKFAFKGIARR
jgi:hypothetical protein